MEIPATLKPELYEPKSNVETPAVFVDLDAMERNMTDYAEFAIEHDVALRSHVKTHKIPDLAHRQQELPAGEGVLCQTLSEVEVMAQSGIDDIYLSYMVVEESKLDRLIWLSDKLDSFATTVDSRANLDPIREAARRHDATVDVILELDVGLNRVGVEPGERAVQLAKTIDEAPEVRFAGIMAYEAHVAMEADGKAELERLCLEAMDTIEAGVEEIENAGVPVEEVKVGGTTTSKFSGKHPVVTEINPGMYPFNDVGELQRRNFELTKYDCALTVASTVISKPTEDRAIVDAGSKSISLDIDGLQPIPKHRDDVTYEGASEEHGWIDTSDSETPIEVGDRIEFIIPHVCTTVNLHDSIVGVRDDRVEEVWEVQARGKVK
jgi:D-serine deaminase-like pyridoxal phosphate-dependent protein